MTKQWRLVVEADCNDADFVTSQTDVTQEVLDRFLGILDKLPDDTDYGYGKKWPKGERADDFKYEEFDEEVSKWMTTEDPRMRLIPNPEDIEFLDSLTPEDEYGIYVITDVWWTPITEVRSYNLK